MSAVSHLVAVGASAGGLDPLRDVVRHLPQHAGLATVVLTHLQPDSPTALADLLGAVARVPVSFAEDGEPVAADTIWVLPPDRMLTVLDGHFRLAPRPDGAHLPIDRFLASLAEHDGPAAVAVILSGTGSDGTRGAIEVKAAGGQVFVQDPATAEYAAMPNAVIAAGAADHVLSADIIGQRLASLTTQDSGPTPYGPTEEETVRTLLTLIEQATGSNLGYYRIENLLRRVRRRAFLGDARSVDEYVERVRRQPDELRALHDDILIGVTAFFRDPQLAPVLQEHAFPRLCANFPAEGLRVWIPACSTGEEVYSIAFLLFDYLRHRKLPPKVQFFCTDVSETAIDVARGACYSDQSVALVPALYRERYMRRSRDGWVVDKAVRDACVFARHDVLANPPFSDVDLLSCRNLLIYLRKRAQAHLFNVLHYALKPAGLLLLGASETAAASDMFTEVQPGARLFAKREGARRFPMAFTVSDLSFAGRAAAQAAPLERVEEAATRETLARYAPAGFVVDERLDLVQFRGQTAPYLAPSPGEATLNLIGLLRPEIQADVQGALLEARRTRAPVRRERVRLNGLRHALDVVPLDVAQATGRYFLIGLSPSPERSRDVGPAPGGRVSEREAALERDLHELQKELDRARAELAALIGEGQAAQEELRTAHEEMLSANEELQSTNEELQSAKEELESANEELKVANTELSRRNDALGRANDDLSNLIENLSFPVLILDEARRLVRYTPLAERDLGIDDRYLRQPLGELPLSIPAAELERLVGRAIEASIPGEAEFQDARGKWHLLRVRPYRTAAKRVQGAVLSLQDIHTMHDALHSAEEARAEAEQANASKDEFLALVSHELRSPLNAVLGWAEVLKRMRPDIAPEDLARAIDVIERNSRAQARLIDDLLDVSRIVSRKFSLDLQMVDVRELGASVAESFRPQAEAQQVELAVVLSNESLVVQGDARRLRQVMTNLLQNAFKFTPVGGRVTLRAQRIEGLVEVTVMDTGEGIAADALPFIFERFRQADGSRTRRHGGLGLGLTIVRHVVEAHGGRVRAESAGPGGGSQFSFVLAAAQAAVSAVPARDSKLASLRGQRILVVEDEDDSREAVAALLELCDATVEAAASARHALERARSGSFDAIVCDIAMPGEDGASFVRKLREWESDAGRPRTFVVALTGLSSRADRDMARQAGFDEHLAKPVNGSLLTQLLQSSSAGARQ